MVFPITFFVLPKNFFAVFSVMTNDRVCENAEVALPCIKGKVNILNTDVSTYLPAAKNDRSPFANNKEAVPSLVRHVLATPGNSSFMAGPIPPGVDDSVKT